MMNYFKTAERSGFFENNRHYERNAVERSNSIPNRHCEARSNLQIEGIASPAARNDVKKGKQLN
jgi:hypothetical protein